MPAAPAMLQSFRIQRAGELAVHIIENVGYGIFRKAFEAGVRRPAEMGREHDVVELEDRVILRQRFFDENIERRAGDGIFL